MELAGFPVFNEFSILHLSEGVESIMERSGTNSFENGAHDFLVRCEISSCENQGSQEDGSEDDCDATLAAHCLSALFEDVRTWFGPLGFPPGLRLAFDHRSWWGRPELRAAVQVGAILVL